MNRRNLRRTFAACLLISVAVPVVALADPGNMMHIDVNTKMQMSNVPMQIPPQSHGSDVCVPKTFDTRDIVAHARGDHSHGECQVTDYKLNGVTGGTFHYTCTGQMAMDGDATFATKTGGGAHVAINMNGTNHGQSMSMAMTIDASPTGASCDYTGPKAAQ